MDEMRSAFEKENTERAPVENAAAASVGDAVNTAEVEHGEAAAVDAESRAEHMPVGGEVSAKTASSAGAQWTAAGDGAAKGGKRLEKGGHRVVRAALVVLGVLVAAYLGLCAWAEFGGRIAPNTYFGGVNYGGLTREAAEEKLGACLSDTQSAWLDVVLADDGEIVARVELGKLGLTVDVQSMVETMCRKPYSGFFMGGAYYANALLFGGREINDATYEESFRAVAKPVLGALAREVVEFSAEVTEDARVLVTKARDGRVPTEAAEETIVSALYTAYFGGGVPSEVVLEAGVEYTVVPAQAVDLTAEREKLVSERVNASYDVENECIVPSSVGVSFARAVLEEEYESAEAGEVFTLTATVEQPEVTTGMLEAGLFRDELSSYTTRVNGADGRHKNVQLTAERIDGYILNAGETMQYGPLVTPFTKENGYFPAPGYLKGKTVDMYGGGACQASSTLYAAVLYADLEVVQRVNHGYASDYIGLGLDATVAEGGPEFEFRNSTLYPIKVQAEYFTKDGKDYIKITLLGTKTDDHYVKIVTEVLSTTPYEEEIVETDELAPGEREVEQTAYTGYLVKTYRNVYAGDGTLLSSEYEATSRYNARNRIIRVGKEVEPVDGATVTGGETAADGGETVPDDGTELSGETAVGAESDIKNE